MFACALQMFPGFRRCCYCRQLLLHGFFNIVKNLFDELTASENPLVAELLLLPLPQRLHFRPAAYRANPRILEPGQRMPDCRSSACCIPDNDKARDLDLLPASNQPLYIILFQALGQECRIRNTFRFDVSVQNVPLCVGVVTGFSVTLFSRGRNAGFPAPPA